MDLIMIKGKMPKILQLKISLKGSNPRIWRRFLVEDSISFHRLHVIIQKVMGWENYHLYEFGVNNTQLGQIDLDALDSNPELEDSEKIQLSEYINEKKQKISYLYDFGDNWEHLVVVEKILEKDNSQRYPICLDGERNGPPEDAGGTWGYSDKLKIRKNKNHPRYKELIVEWLGEDFDPEKFDLDEINKKLQRIK